MRYRSIAWFATLATLAMFGITLGSAANAADDAEKFPNRLFAENFAPQGKSYACFTRRYDAAHLAKHTLQKVSAMTLLVTAEKVPEYPNPDYSFRLGIKFRDRPGAFDSSGFCGHPEAFDVSADKLHLGCGVDCDGGGISIEMANADKSTLIRLESIRIWRNNKPEEEPFALEGGADDRVFRLDRASLEECKSLVARSQGTGRDAAQVRERAPCIDATSSPERSLVSAR
jgi:hypothetical protein